MAVLHGWRDKQPTMEQASDRTEAERMRLGLLLLIPMTSALYIRPDTGENESLQYAFFVMSECLTKSPCVPHSNRPRTGALFLLNEMHSSSLVM